MTILVVQQEYLYKETEFFSRLPLLDGRKYLLLLSSAFCPASVFSKEIINYLFVHVFQTQKEYVLSTDQILPVVNI